MQHLCIHTALHRASAVRSGLPLTSGRSLACLVVSQRGLRTCTSNSRSRAVCCASHDYPSQTDFNPVFRAFLSVGVSIDDFKRAQRLEPALISEYQTDRVNAILDLLLNLGLSGTDIGHILIAYPQAFKLSLDHHAQPVVDFLRCDLGLGRAELRALLTRFPAVLGMNVKGHLRPQVHYLASLGVPAESLPSLVLSRPLVLGPGIDTVVNFLLRRGVARSQMHRLLRSYPLDYGLTLKGISAAAPGSSSSGDRGKGRDRSK